MEANCRMHQESFAERSSLEPSLWRLLGAWYESKSFQIAHTRNGGAKLISTR